MWYSVGSFIENFHFINCETNRNIYLLNGFLDIVWISTGTFTWLPTGLSGCCTAKLILIKDESLLTSTQYLFKWWFEYIQQHHFRSYQHFTCSLYVSHWQKSLGGTYQTAYDVNIFCFYSQPWYHGKYYSRVFKHNKYKINCHYLILHRTPLLP